MNATLLDLGVGNLHSLSRALEHLGVRCAVSASPLEGGGLLVLPGVGAFGRAADALAPFRNVLRAQLASGRPTLGICLGMQLLFDRSEEDASRAGRGLGVLAGEVTRLSTRRVPHIGWTRLEGGRALYFAHSFACRPADPGIVRWWARHDDERFPAVLRHGSIAATQFHPEKSSVDGLALLKSLLEELES